jgi:hypothetical protein
MQMTQHSADGPKREDNTPSLVFLYLTKTQREHRKLRSRVPNCISCEVSHVHPLKDELLYSPFILETLLVLYSKAKAQQVIVPSLVIPPTLLNIPFDQPVDITSTVSRRLWT